MSSSTSVPRFKASNAVLRVESTSLRVQQPPSSSDMVSLAMGEPDFDTPPRIIAAAAEALQQGYTHYAPLLGDKLLCQALAEQVSSLSGDPVGNGEILVTHGGTGGLAAAILSIVNPGDRVVIPDPTYSLYADLVNMAGGVCLPMPCRADLHWDLELLESMMEGARLFIFCNPGNPTGIVHSQREIETLGRIVRKTGTLVIADEAYSDLVFTDQAFTSVLQVPAFKGRTLYCQTFSKSYAMTGWRVGYLAGPADMITAAARVHNTLNGSVNTAVQRAALVALKSCGDDVKRMYAVYRERRALMMDGLSAIPGLALNQPEGAFYCFPSYSLPIPAIDMVGLLREQGLAVRPGSEFGAAGESHLRLSYAASKEAIAEGVARLKRGLAMLS
ncbi:MULTISPECIES: pyridoxal phosphate-dependent aminotransferase [unclassified Brenneria]|uniref:pyridoxal phosphate-dependent aminotransferase n=1 Tax=unclassified Brenneria TaxID=2634434 RepID=UPI001554E854|nr:MULTISPECIES: aminotransferase class I/II-fold pyridoxal phosphate-dependent enzyme [unclassified Brenneria]MBJ7223930.1 aminotransferase class I/II-fold pyridoxal phosphate-dependent enzyme [Brenneria sp. L3-3C-1]MEE3645174.1 aminotransferase class I/II-fold pyridoxal phosphate-dependent enzyme [Brenneria sp. L3_3C_1]MEE3649943.1 aminotransferase class I/II-fold pyridoxal phosphate-dependent enzyme [Brenneria sp. HEZEL_4_2_4]NPC99901.1 aminotransferase class I/II-fold pyridoxal phosphate-de